jgi:hypothetical protein
LKCQELLLQGPVPHCKATSLQQHCYGNLRPCDVNAFCYFQDLLCDLVRGIYANALWSYTVTSVVHKLYSSLTPVMVTDFLCFISSQPTPGIDSGTGVRLVAGLKLTTTLWCWL